MQQKFERCTKGTHKAKVIIENPRKYQKGIEVIILFAKKENKIDKAHRIVERKTIQSKKKNTTKQRE